MKDFEGWHEVKQRLDTRERPPTFQEREIWWCSVGVNIGFEIFGKSQIYTRPVLVVRKFNRFTFLGVPLTSKQKDNPYYYPIHFEGRNVNALLAQLRAFDSKRLAERMGYLTDEQFERVKQTLKKMI